MNIIVNGGTKGIGREVVLNLAQNSNNQIIVTGRDNKILESLSNDFKNVSTLSIDLSQFDKYSEKLKDAVSGQFKKVDVLINMAGFLVSKKFSETSDIEARLMMETNFFGPSSVIRLIKPLMAHGSHIVNISSMGGFQGSEKYPGLSYYSASKAAIACLTECLATEFSDDNIRVNCLALGSVQTDMLKEAFPGYKAPVNAKEMAEFISDFALNGQKFFNGKILPVAINNP